MSLRAQALAPSARCARWVQAQCRRHASRMTSECHTMKKCGRRRSNLLSCLSHLVPLHPSATTAAAKLFLGTRRHMKFMPRGVACLKQVSVEGDRRVQEDCIKSLHPLVDSTRLLLARCALSAPRSLAKRDTSLRRGRVPIQCAARFRSADADTGSTLSDGCAWRVCAGHSRRL